MTDAYKATLNYADDVLAGKIKTSKYARLAVERHLKDLETGKERGLRFSEKAAEHVLEFFVRFLRHSKGEWAGQPFHLSPWQSWALSVRFGWLKDDGTRRFRTVFREVARKNGKTTEAAGVGLYLFVADGEPGAQVFSAATKRDQALLTWTEARQMVHRSPDLKSIVRAYHNNLHMLSTASKFEPLGADADTLDGLNIHGAIIDEIHAHKTRDLYDVMDTATGARRQPMIEIITTAGMGGGWSIGLELHEYSQQILEGVKQNDSWFANIYAIDDEDDPFDETVWIKANPNLGVSVKLDTLREKAEKAKDIKSFYNTFLRLHMNRWTEQIDRWLSLEQWDACGAEIDEEKLTGCACFGGLDLSSTLDLTAFVLVFGQDNRTQVLPYFFVPEDNIYARVKNDRQPYDVWAREGHIITTPGNVIDYDFVFHKIKQLAEKFDVKAIAVDRWNSTHISTMLTVEGLNVAAFGQGFASMTAPSKMLETLIAGKKLVHNGHPVLRWNVANAAAATDAAGNIKPAKDRSREKIDGVVALIMALGAKSGAEVQEEFVYNKSTLYVG